MGSRGGGFALVEILIAVAIFAAVAFVVQSTFGVLMGSMEDARERTEISRSAENLLWLVSSEISNAVVAEGLEFVYTEEAGSGEMRFHTTVAYPGAGKKDLFRVFYRVDDGEVWKGVDEDYFKLGSGLDNFGVRFYDGEEWTEDEWDSEDSGYAPRAVEISFEMGGKKFIKSVALQAGFMFSEAPRGRRSEF